MHSGLCRANICAVQISITGVTGCQPRIRRPDRGRRRRNRLVSDLIAALRALNREAVLYSDAVAERLGNALVRRRVPRGPDHVGPDHCRPPRRSHRAVHGCGHADDRPPRAGGLRPSRGRPRRPTARHRRGGEGSDAPSFRPCSARSQHAVETAMERYSDDHLGSVLDFITGALDLARARDGARARDADGGARGLAGLRGAARRRDHGPAGASCRASPTSSSEWIRRPTACSARASRARRRGCAFEAASSRFGRRSSPWTGSIRRASSCSRRRCRSTSISDADSARSRPTSVRGWSSATVAWRHATRSRRAARSCSTRQSPGTSTCGAGCRD